MYWGLELEGGPVERVAPDCYHCLLLEGLRSPPHLRGFRIRDRRITILGENLVTWLLNTRLTREVNEKLGSQIPPCESCFSGQPRVFLL